MPRTNERRRPAFTLGEVAWTLEIREDDGEIQQLSFKSPASIAFESFGVVVSSYEDSDRPNTISRVELFPWHRVVRVVEER